jgi:hypothetical protein
LRLIKNLQLITALEKQDLLQFLTTVK